MSTPQDAVSAWFQMMAEAMRGATEAQAAMLAFAQARTPEDVAQWMARYLPDAVAGQPAGAYSPETWWRLTGFVPRIRYLEQLERNELLRQHYRNRMLGRPRGQVRHEAIVRQRRFQAAQEAQLRRFERLSVRPTGPRRPSAPGPLAPLRR